MALGFTVQPALAQDGGGGSDADSGLAQELTNPLANLATPLRRLAKRMARREGLLVRLRRPACLGAPRPGNESPTPRFEVRPGSGNSGTATLPRDLNSSES
jgi:hypothetical protein